MNPKLLCKRIIFSFSLTLFTCNIAYSTTTDTLSFLTNDDFSSGLAGWEEIRTGKANIMNIGVVEDSAEYPHTLGFKRQGAKKIRGELGVSQSLNKDVSGYNSLVLKADVKIIYSSFKSDRLPEGAYAVTIKLEYLDEDGAIRWWKHGFLYGEVIKYKDIGEKIPQNQWYSYISQNLLELSPKPKIINQLRIYGDGWEFWARVANVQLIANAKTLIPQDEIQEEVPKEKVVESKEEIKVVLKEEVVPEEKVEEPLVTNVFVDVDIRQVIRDIATQAQITIILDDSVQGMVSIEFNNVPLEKALKMLLVTGGYVFKKIENYYLIASPDPANSTFPLLSSVERIKLNYLKAENISNLLIPHYSKYILVDKGENILIVTAPSEIIEEIKEYIKKIDLPQKQILIETLVTELSDEARKELGIDWSIEGGKSKVKLISPLQLEGSYLSTAVSSQALATIKILTEKGKAKIRANPRILTLTGKSASIYIGREEYYSLPGTAYQPGRFDKILSGITLKITPYTGGNDEITVTIEPEVSDVSAIGKEGYPIISKRTAQTTVRVKDGKTIIIGGLIQQKEGKRISKIPVIGSIPILGAFFRKNSSYNTETEVVIFITPHIID